MGKEMAMSPVRYFFDSSGVRDISSSSFFSWTARASTPAVMAMIETTSIQPRVWSKKMKIRIAVTTPEEFCMGEEMESSIYLSPRYPMVMDRIYMKDTGK